MTIGDIKALEKAQKLCNDTMRDIIDREKETVAFFIEQEKINNKWTEDFLEELG
jgi:hypothetical protein